MPWLGQEADEGRNKIWEQLVQRDIACRCIKKAEAQEPELLLSTRSALVHACMQKCSNWSQHHQTAAPPTRRTVGAQKRFIQRSSRWQKAR